MKALQPLRRALLSVSDKTGLIDLPRSAKQVVLSGRAMAYATRVRWSLAKAQDTPDVVRDLAPIAVDEET